MDCEKVKEIEQQLMFHKALAEETEEYQRFSRYLEILDGVEGERLNDPVDEAIRAMFSLVLDRDIDPWEIDLREFVRMYAAKMSKESLPDMIVAGRLMLMAWMVLNKQSQSTRAKGETVPEDDGFDILDDFGYEDEDIMMVPEVNFGRAYARENIRTVTMTDIIEAGAGGWDDIASLDERERIFEEARAARREAIRKEEADRRFDNKAHDEDDKKDLEDVWSRIVKMGAGAMMLGDLYTGVLKDDLKTFIAVLHLAKEGRVDVRQDLGDDGGFGDAFVEIISFGRAAAEVEAEGEAILEVN